MSTFLRRLMWGNFFVDRAHVEISPALRRARSQHCPCDQLTSMLGFWTTHQEGDVIHFIYNPASCRRSRGSFAGTAVWKAVTRRGSTDGGATGMLWAPRTTFTCGARAASRRIEAA